MNQRSNPWRYALLIAFGGAFGGLIGSLLMGGSASLILGVTLGGAAGGLFLYYWAKKQ